MYSVQWENEMIAQASLVSILPPAHEKAARRRLEEFCSHYLPGGVAGAVSIKTDGAEGSCVSL
jgi:hypothetical protein